MTRHEFMRLADALLADAEAKTKAQAALRAKPADPEQHRSRFGSAGFATWAMVCHMARLLDIDGLTAARTQIAPFASKVETALGRMAGHSYDHALIEARRQRADFGAGQRKAPPQGKPEILREFSEIRRAAKEAAAEASHQACQIAADYLEGLVEKIPTYRQHMEDAEKQIYPDAGKLGKSPLLRKVGDLEHYILSIAKKYREVPTVRDLNTILPTVSE